MGTYFAYARVSTPRQGEKGVSLVEQRSAIERYARQHELTITKWFEERESASHTGRPAFNDMLRLLRLRKVQGVVIHKIDRTARNMQDWADVGKLVDAGVEIHFASENVDLQTVGGRLSADIQAVVAAHYSRNLREEVKKGLYGRLKQGFYPFRAPIGYRDCGSAKPKVPDPARAPLLVEAFMLYRTGRWALPALAEELYRRGLRNLNGGIVTVNGLATILKNPFYMGLIRIVKTGQTFASNHEPLVTSEVFGDVQAMLAGKRVDRSKSHVFTYSRIVRCKSCNYSLIAERQKGHVYYRCHNRPFKNPAVCPATSIREEELDQAVESCLREIDLSDEELSVIRTAVARARAESETGRIAAIQALRLQIEHTHARLAKLTDYLVDGTIDKSVFNEKQEAALREEVVLKDRLAEIESGSRNLIAQIERTVERAQSPSVLYAKASTEKKREMLGIFLSNLAVTGKKAEMTLTIPFRLIAEREKSSDGRPYRGACRTWENIIHHLEKHFENHNLTHN
jgi:DNA invertase Pin-like site-specific DNA recombinase